MRIVNLLRCGVLLWFVCVASMLQAAPNKAVVQLDIDGAIGPATSDYIRRNLDKAVEAGAQLVILRIDTPGGLDTSMREIIKKIIASPLPMVGYVAPSGARAASAGTYILYACHIAAMAPATNLGAATPVEIVNIGTPPERERQKDGDNDAKPDSTPAHSITEKAINDAVAYIRGLAAMRGRNADWAEKAVREAASLPAEEALKLKVIDLLAVDIDELLNKLDGRKVSVMGRDISLQTRGASVDEIVPDWRSELLATISNPNVAYILLLIGLYGLAIEFTHPGAIAPGTVGTICLLLALYAFQLLPINYAGIALIILGMGLMVAEAFAPSFGVLGIGGVCAFVFGSIIMMDAEAPGYRINVGLISGFAFSSAVFLIFVLGMLLKMRRKPLVSGREELLGGTGTALEDFAETGKVRVHSEIWQAHSDCPLRKGDTVRVTGLDGLILTVVPGKTEEKLK